MISRQSIYICQNQPLTGMIPLRKELAPIDAIDGEKEWKRERASK